MPFSALPWFIRFIGHICDSRERVRVKVNLSPNHGAMNFSNAICHDSKVNKWMMGHKDTLTHAQCIVAGLRIFGNQLFNSLTAASAAGGARLFRRCCFCTYDLTIYFRLTICFRLLLKHAKPFETDKNFACIFHSLSLSLVSLWLPCCLTSLQISIVRKIGRN